MSFMVSRYDDYWTLNFPNHELFAQVSELVSRGLSVVQNFSSIEVKAFVETKKVQDILRRAKKPGEATLKANFNIYGSMDDARAVGNKLSAAKMFLQDPDHETQDIEYRNPHVIQFPGVEEPIIEGRENGAVAKPNKPSKALREERDHFDQMRSTIYQLLTRSRHLEGMQGGQLLRTPLLPHQERALYFMRQRETGPIPPEFSLWKSECNIITKLYRHKLTDAELPVPPNELGGGILADDMGMGKSLSTLALVTTTAEEAHLWWSDTHVPPKKLRSRATLILVPSPLIMSSWLKEIDMRLDKSVTVVKCYGKNRDNDMQAYLDCDIVFSTYHTVSASLNQGTSVIFGIEWFRVVLDEAHMIRRRETTLYEGASQISAKFRWCLTGTPIQNHLEDIGSLLAFLRVKELENKAAFNKYIITPFERDFTLAAKNFAFLLDSLCLRRTQDLLHLPDITEKYHYVTLTQDERLQYDESMNKMAKYIRDKVSLKSGKRDPFGIFQVKLQLRLLCNHGTFQKPFSRDAKRSQRDEREDFFYSLGRNAEIVCSACGIPIPVFDVIGGSQSYKHPCGHELCQECINTQNQDEDSIQSRAFTAPCPLCRSQVEQGTPQQSQEGTEHANNYFNPIGYSSKIEALMEDIQRNSGAGKSIVFSCWTRTLDLVSMHLRRKRILHQRIDGDLVLSQRQYNMDRFVNDERYPILLMSTGVGAFGLNLTAANHVYILEPQWNPSVESQAIGRVSRLGQHKPVSVTRYLVRGTVEVKMHSQQIRKLELAKLGFQNDESPSST
ncbi:SNF2 family N-terminal domain-containing protein [Nemania abortiva]|nr:SNF2 family N-terminal domain-containing protein [Nemania abortiva]